MKTLAVVLMRLDNPRHDNSSTSFLRNESEILKLLGLSIVSLIRIMTPFLFLTWRPLVVDGLHRVLRRVLLRGKGSNERGNRQSQHGASLALRSHRLSHGQRLPDPRHHLAQQDVRRRRGRRKKREEKSRRRKKKRKILDESL